MHKADLPEVQWAWCCRHHGVGCQRVGVARYAKKFGLSEPPPLAAWQHHGGHSLVALCLIAAACSVFAMCIAAGRVRSPRLGAPRLSCTALLPSGLGSALRQPYQELLSEEVAMGPAESSRSLLMKE